MTRMDETVNDNMVYCSEFWTDQHVYKQVYVHVIEQYHNTILIIIVNPHPCR